MDWHGLIGIARVARGRAYVPYSSFAVGAALLTGSGKVYPGCNVENASYSACICAERTALVSAIAAGERDLVALVVVAGGPRPVPPCGVCRQMLSEFAPELPLTLANLEGATLETTMTELLPGAFAAKDMG
ncbi:MAG: cytidine deaminase [Herpetosiphonaceae bacterium]|nr:cytidine deaminase [Herpetosiphonaceae bacterium]